MICLVLRTPLDGRFVYAIVFCRKSKCCEYITSLHIQHSIYVRQFEFFVFTMKQIASIFCNVYFVGQYNNIIVYQKYIGTSIKVGCATHNLSASSDPKTEGVPTNTQRGRGSGSCRLWRGLDKTSHIVPTALLVRVQRWRNYPYKAVEEPITRPIVLSMISGSYFRRRRRLTFVDYITIEDRMRVPSETYSWNDISPKYE